MKRKSEKPKTKEKQITQSDIFYAVNYSGRKDYILEQIAKIPALDINYHDYYTGSLIELLKTKNDPDLLRAAYKKFPPEQQLFVAACFGYSKKVSRFIREKVDVNLQTQSGTTALYLAALYGNIECVKLLLAAGAAVNSKTVLYKLMAEGNEEAIKVRINQKGVDPHIISPLCAATQGKHHEIMELLLAHGADVHQLSPYGVAYEHQLRQAAEECSQDSKRIHERHAYSAMHIAAGNDDLKAMDILLKNGASLKQSASFVEVSCCGLMSDQYSTSTPFHHAVAKGNCAAVQYLIDRGADVNKVAHDVLPRRFMGDLDGVAVGVTPLHLATKTQNTALVDKLLDQGAEINTSLRVPYEHVSSYVREQQTPLDLALRQANNVALIQKLMSRGARLTNWDNSFAYAIGRNDLPVIKLLLAYRPQEKRDLRLFLSAIIKNNQIDIVRLFIKHGVKLQPKDLKLAQDCGHELLEQELKKAMQKPEQSNNRLRWFASSRSQQPVNQERVAVSALK
ncbi:MAG: ankyrin repeat domain-containing protein [Legionella sp.]|nr:MAG: ankyrin repeat domain-containing protein [Legionella sp.]